ISHTAEAEVEAEAAATSDAPSVAMSDAPSDATSSVATSSVATSMAPALNTAARTLILGIDISGRILQCDRHAPKVLGRSPGELLGAELGDITVDKPDQKEALTGLIDPMRSGRESTAMLTIYADDGRPTEAVVTVQPMTATDPDLTALALIRVPLPNSERFTDPAVMRRALLDDSFIRVGTTLDVDQMARELMDVIVPHFCNVFDLLILESLVGADEIPAEDTDAPPLLRRLAVSYDDDDPGWDAAFPTGEALQHPPGTAFVRCMQTGEAILTPHLTPDDAAKIAEAWRRKPVAKLLSDTSMLLLPLIARDTILGMLVCIRKPGNRRFDPYDIGVGMEFAGRAAIFLDNARRYSRERATALTLQRSLLPTGLAAPSSVEVRHRYLPGSKLMEIGGDWYESIALPGARVALVIGDVAGHGVHAAVTMGRLRAAIHTLAGLELAPADALQQLDEL